MPHTPTAPSLGEPKLDQMRAGEPEVIDDAWKDDIVQRLLRELKRQLCQLENTKPTPEIDQANIRIVNVRALAAMERTLDRLLRMDEQRELKRETKVAKTNDHALERLKRRLDQLLAASATLADSGEPRK